VLFIGTRFSNLYTAVHTPAKVLSLSPSLSGSLPCPGLSDAPWLDCRRPGVVSLNTNKSSSSSWLKRRSARTPLSELSAFSNVSATYIDCKIVQRVFHPPLIASKSCAQHESTIVPLPLAIIGKTTVVVVAVSPGLVKALRIRRICLSRRHCADRELLEVGARRARHGCCRGRWGSAGGTRLRSGGRALLKSCGRALLQSGGRARLRSGRRARSGQFLSIGVICENCRSEAACTVPDSDRAFRAGGIQRACQALEH